MDLVTYVKDYGFAMAVATLLLWVILFRSPDVLTSKVDAQTVIMQSVAATLDGHARVMDTRIVESQQADQKMLRFLYLMCLNTSKTQSARDACESVLK